MKRWLAIGLGALVVAVGALSAGHGGSWFHSSTPTYAQVPDADSDGFVDALEMLLGSDPLDAVSTPEDAGYDYFTASMACADGDDNDADGLPDGTDPGCLDSDGDGYSDEGESRGGSNPADPDSTPESSLLDLFGFLFGFWTCSDGLDNDLDGLTDGADPGCAPLVDTDGDGVPDLADNCPSASNPDQTDSDFDGDGDACDDFQGDLPPDLLAAGLGPVEDFTFDAGGDLLVGGGFSGRITRLSFDITTPLPIDGSAVQPEVVGNHAVFGLAFDDEDDLWISEFDNGEITELGYPLPSLPFDASGAAPTASLTVPDGVAFAPPGSPFGPGLYVGDVGAGGIFTVAADGSTATFASLGCGIEEVTFNSTGDMLYAAAPTCGNIWAIEPDGTASVLASGFLFPDAIAVAPGNEFGDGLFVGDLFGNTLYLVDTVTGDITVARTFGPGFDGFEDIVFGPDGNMYILAFGRGGQIFRIGSPLPPDSDGDGIPDIQDACPLEDSTGFDADDNGCIDQITDLGTFFDTLFEEGAIDSTMHNSLHSKIDAAVASWTRDNVCAAVGQLDALRNQIEAQTGKKVSADAAPILLEFITNVQNYMLIVTGVGSC